MSRAWWKRLYESRGKLDGLKYCSDDHLLNDIAKSTCHEPIECTPKVTWRTDISVLLIPSELQLNCRRPSFHSFIQTNQMSSCHCCSLDTTGRVPTYPGAQLAQRYRKCKTSTLHSSDALGNGHENAECTKRVNTIIPHDSMQLYNQFKLKSRPHIDREVRS